MQQETRKGGTAPDRMGRGPDGGIRRIRSWTDPWAASRRIAPFLLCYHGAILPWFCLYRRVESDVVFVLETLCNQQSQAGSARLDYCCLNSPVPDIAHAHLVSTGHYHVDRAAAGL